MTAHGLTRQQRRTRQRVRMHAQTRALCRHRRRPSGVGVALSVAGGAALCALVWVLWAGVRVVPETDTAALIAADPPVLRVEPAPPLVTRSAPPTPEAADAPEVLPELPVEPVAVQRLEPFEPPPVPRHEVDAPRDNHPVKTMDKKRPDSENGGGDQRERRDGWGQDRDRGGRHRADDQGHDRSDRGGHGQRDSGRDHGNDGGSHGGGDRGGHDGGSQGGHSSGNSGKGGGKR